MGTNYRVLGQVALGATTLTDIYRCPNYTVISSIVVCNRKNAAVVARISVAVAGATDDPKQYLIYDTSIPANDSLPCGQGITLGPGDVIRGYASSADISVNVFGGEIT
jgi:hypothetical protein